MILETKYNEGDMVWVINSKTGDLVEREVAGIRTQSINKEQHTVYCFVKDWFQDKENPELKDCFWVGEGKVYESKQRYIASLQ